MLKKIITWAIFIFIAFFVLSDPSGAGGVIHGLLDLLKNAGSQLGAFVHST